MRNLLLTAIFLVACGDNIHPNDGDPSKSDDVVIDDDLVVDPGDGEGPVCEPDAGIPDLDTETKGACCHALLNGAPPNQECGYPPGLCKNGKKTMFCKNELGEDAQFELCNP